MLEFTMIGALLGSRLIAAFEIKDFFQHANFLEFYNNKTVLADFGRTFRCGRYQKSDW